RTARAGKDGQAVAFCAPDEMDELKAIQKTMKITIPVASGRPWEVLPDPAAPKGRRGGPGGGGKPGGGGRPGGNRRRRGGGGGRGGQGQSGGQGGSGQGNGQGGQRRRSS
ncbi:MAG: ATP-dependent helicase, partial [Pseudomonadota bacterium]|nr:ATP-dependent helicase [Pseudomonadota bacterium]